MSRAAIAPENKPPLHTGGGRHTSVQIGQSTGLQGVAQGAGHRLPAWGQAQRLRRYCRERWVCIMSGPSFARPSSPNITGSRDQTMKLCRAGDRAEEHGRPVAENVGAARLPCPVFRSQATVKNREVKCNDGEGQLRWLLHGAGRGLKQSNRRGSSDMRAPVLRENVGSSVVRAVKVIGKKQE